MTNLESEPCKVVLLWSSRILALNISDGGEGGRTELAYCEIVSRSSAYLRKANPASVSPELRLTGLPESPPPAAINLTLQSLQEGVRG